MRTVSFAVFVALTLSACADQDALRSKVDDLDAREARLEHIAANDVELSQRVDQLQNTQRDMQGRIDELEHANQALIKQQHDLYGDLDKRLAAAAGGAGAGAAVAGGAAAEGPSSVEQAVYNQSFDALKAGSYSIAITGFKDFLTNYPQSSLAENAQYWLGEAYYVDKQYGPAAGAFRSVLSKYPDSRKAPDAMLKLGYTQFEQKQYPAARATFTEVTNKYPGTDQASGSRTCRRLPDSRSAPARVAHAVCCAHASPRTAEDHRDLPLPAGRSRHRGGANGVRAPHRLPAALPVLRHRLRFSRR
jgi:tol-pal system protein YbgF